LFSYDPETDGDEQVNSSLDAEYDEYDENDDMEPTEVVTHDGAHDTIALDIYASHQRITSSDHKPIISVFTLDYDAVVPELKAQVHVEVARELDRVENEGRPDVTLIVEGATNSGDSIVDLGDVAFMERKSTSMTIANTGSVSATFSFVETPSTEQGDSSVPEWVKTFFVRPDDERATSVGKSVTLEPGETVLALVEAQVSAMSHLRALNESRVDIEHVLVLRVEDGRDHFIPVRGNWLPTTFGRSIDELIRIPDGGIRKFMADKGIHGSIPYDSDVHCSAPKELFKITEAIQTLAERCMADETMLEEVLIPRDYGWPFDSSTWASAGLPEQEALRSSLITALDTDANLLEAIPVEVTSTQRLELLASVLLLFLESLTDGIIPAHLWAKPSASIPNLTGLPPTVWSDTRTHILDVLSSAPNHNIAFVFLTATLSRVAAELTPTAPDPLRPILGRRLSLRRSGGDADVTKKRRAREKRFAEIVAPLACRTNEKDKGTKEKERAVIEMFVNKEAAG
jgi:inositol polyphosphate 5-phosphatase INPP5B/F